MDMIAEGGDGTVLVGFHENQNRFSIFFYCNRSGVGKKHLSDQDGIEKSTRILDPDPSGARKGDGNKKGDAFHFCGQNREKQLETAV
jgi:hypothetical protein